MKFLDYSGLAKIMEKTKQYIDTSIDLKIKGETHCPNCGALITEEICPYCGTNFSKMLLIGDNNGIN